MPSPGEYLDLLDPLANHPLNRGLVFLWLGLEHLSGGGSVYDLTNRTAGGVPTGGPTWIAWKDGFAALSFDGINDYVSVPTLPKLPDDYTVVMEVTPSGGLLDQYLLADWSFAERNFLFRLEGSEIVELLNGDGTTNQDSTCTGNALSIGSRYVIGARRSGSTFNVWQDGIQVASVAGAHSGGSTSNTVNLFADGSGTSNFPGSCGLVAIYDRALSDGEMLGVADQICGCYPDTLRRVSNRVWSFGADQGGVAATGYKYLPLLGVG